MKSANISLEKISREIFSLKLIKWKSTFIDRYKNHPSICKIKSEVSSKSFSDSDFSPNILITSDEVEKMWKSLNSKKAAGTDRITIITE